MAQVIQWSELKVVQWTGHIGGALVRPYTRFSGQTIHAVQRSDHTSSRAIRLQTRQVVRCSDHTSGAVVRLYT